MAKVFNLKGNQVFEIDGVPFSVHAKLLEHWQEELAKQIDTNDYLEIKTKVGWVEFHFYENQ